jgi:hypothetical protein
MTDRTPTVVTRYLSAADAGDFLALADCFTPSGSVVDEGKTFRGHAEIIEWRETLAAKWIYTSAVSESEAIASEEYRVHIHVEGNFPGGVADLIFRFRLLEGLIDELFIDG